MPSGNLLRRARAGAPRPNSARAYNAMLDAAEDFQRRRLAPARLTPRGTADESGLVLVYNDTAAALPRFSVVTVSGIAISPSENLAEFQAGPILKVGAPAAGKTVAITQESIPSHEYGKALVSGVTPVQIDVLDVEHTRCAVIAGDTAKLLSDTSGPLAILWKSATGSGSGSGETFDWAVVSLTQTQVVAAAVVPVKLTAKTNDTTYTGNVFANGTDLTASESSVSIRVEGMATGETLPNNVVFHAVLQSWDADGSGSGTARVNQWTIIDAPRLV